MAIPRHLQYDTSEAVYQDEWVAYVYSPGLEYSQRSVGRGSIITHLGWVLGMGVKIMNRHERATMHWTYHDRATLEDDFEVIHSREIGVNWHSNVIETPCSPQRGCTALLEGDSGAPTDDIQLGLDPSSEGFEEEVEADIVTEPLPQKKRRVKSKLSWEGRGNFRKVKTCPDCALRGIEVAGAPEFRSLDCFMPDLRHRLNPFHIIERWAETRPCDALFLSVAMPTFAFFTRMAFMTLPLITATTCSTFMLLRLLHHLTLTSKASTYDFYRALEKETNNTGVSVPKSRYRQLLRTILQFRHLKMLKRGGVAHNVDVAKDPLGIESVKPGALAVLCPHCPYPGINLPEGWEKAPDDSKFLYYIFYCMDANFRLKNQLVSSYASDPGLRIGMAYMVPRRGYEEYVLSRASDADISTCVGFAALAKANTKFAKGLRYTGIPAFHKPAHGQARHQEYSCKLSPGMDMTDGKCPERIWAAHNMLGNAMKTQGPGSCHDVIDDHLGFWNWCKYTSMVGQSAISEEGEEPIHNWGKNLTEAQIRKDLADEEEDRLDKGLESPNVMNMSSFVILGLELEESQCRIREMAKSKAATGTSRQESSLTELRNVLRAKIRTWERLRDVYMPGVHSLQVLQDQHPTSTVRSQEFRPPSATNHPEDIDLWLPSTLSAASWASICPPWLSSIEEKLRVAQCNDSLDNIHQILRIKARMVLFKHKHVRGQREGMRSQAVIDRIHASARVAVERYRHARLAKMSLSGPGDWEKGLCPLLDSDIRAYQDLNKMKEYVGQKGMNEVESDEEGGDRVQPPNFRRRKDGTGETRRTLSWIWVVEGFRVSEDSADDNILWSEWAKSHARAKRTTEDVLLLCEEMRRTGEFLAWKARWWEGKANARRCTDKSLAEGLCGYALEQAALQKTLRASFQAMWKGPLEDVKEEGSQEEEEDLEVDEDCMDVDEGEGDEERDVDSEDDAPGTNEDYEEDTDGEES
ncbi:uncharacterized protein LACBIDRAFT_329781 [Laccaria bicolor S238N-H82]|uniref:Predicted protein n=1 Tax=Laccaria bicolor (strain S238N-H82 / ATCC MYA-4686) TaxID=486041 RepID=B0DJ80_LACBS|nr:uncharacterized protein LACBIDRAFT_329781 [Laccaria bicolor S238N-H82]EDR05358.1 predicted protein [Laccaria bicolor S238N-H82]|eukprot:XP_001883916.1 predicted protein [Laccaria bicolor S238N-H82]